MVLFVLVKSSWMPESAALERAACRPRWVVGSGLTEPTTQVRGQIFWRSVCMVVISAVWLVTIAPASCLAGP